VQQLEAGELPLEESLQLFEQGVGALKRCHAILDKAEKRIRLLIKGPDGEPQLQDANLPAAPASAPKKSAKQSVDSGASGGQNAATPTEVRGQKDFFGG
jgi:exodeoxyribonuclease VII small subunit